MANASKTKPNRYDRAPIRPLRPSVLLRVALQRWLQRRFGAGQNGPGAGGMENRFAPRGGPSRLRLSGRWGTQWQGRFCYSARWPRRARRLLDEDISGHGRTVLSL